MNESKTTPPKGASSSERLTHIESVLADYEREIGLPELQTRNESEVTRLLQLSSAEIRALTREQADEAAIIMEGFAIYLQRVSNKEQSRIHWAEANINSIIGPTIMDYRGYSHEERRMQAVPENEASQALEKIRVHAQLRLDRTAFLASKVEALSRAFGNLSGNRNRG